MKTRIFITCLNVLLFAAMVIHIGVSMYLHGRQPEYSAPMYVELLNGLYYVIPLAVVNIVGLLINKK